MDKSPQRARSHPPIKARQPRGSAAGHGWRVTGYVLCCLLMVTLGALGPAGCRSPVGAGTTASSAVAAATTATDGASTSGTAAPTSPVSTSAPTTLVSPAVEPAGTTTTEPAAPRATTLRALRVQTFPAGAHIEIDLPDGPDVAGTSPFVRQVPEGSITINASLEGYNPASRDLALGAAAEVDIWLDPVGQLYQSVVRFESGKQPKQVLFSPDGKELWVAILGGGVSGLEAYDPRTGERLAAIRLGGHEGTELVMTKDGSTIFVSQMATSTIWEVDRASRKVVRHFRSGGSYTKVLLLSRDEKLLYASNWKSNDVSEIDVATGKVRRIIPAVTTPRGLYITPDSEYLYVSGFGKGELQKIDLATGRGTVVYKTGGTFRHMVADEQRNLLYVGEFSENAIYVLDLATDQVRKLADTDQRPNTIELSPDGKVLYVSNRGMDNPKTGYLTKGPEWGSVLAIDTATGRLLDAIVGGNQCTGLDVSADGRLLAFSDFLDRVIRVYDIPDYSTLQAGGGGRAATHLQDILKD